jgi:UDP-2,3-diacylglucosamine pyrophosphatase LpxH
LTVRRRIVIVSDLHMATGDGPQPDPFADDEPFAALVEAVASDRRPTRLVLLGDTFDFVLAGTPTSSRRDADTAAARRSLDAIAAAHPRVFAALGRYARNEHILVVIPGNHDLELLERSVQQHLRALLLRAAGGGDAASRISFLPWVLHVPGVVYAEHGQQHHDLNYVGNLVAPGGAEVRAPVGVRLDEARAELTRLRISGAPAVDVLRRGAAHAARAGIAGGRLAMPRALRLRADLLHEHAEAVGIPPAALLAVDRHATPSLLTMTTRLGARAMARGRHGSGGFMLGGARAVAGELARAGTPAPFLVFGHTHVAADTALGREPGAPRYINAGTWSTLVRPGGDVRADRLRRVEIEYGAGRAAARLERCSPNVAAARTPS